jgi:carotenoid cleavage dioxygenase-like enzyme
MTVEIVNSVRSTLKPSDHPYLNNAWTPNFEEINAADMTIIGDLPNDIDGVYARNTENPVHEPIGRYHPFDGDGMIHSMSFRDGKAEYRNRFVRTKGLLAEAEAGHSLWTGLMESPREGQRPGWGAHGWLKDTSSTDVVAHAGKLLSTFYQCGDGYRLDPYTMEQLGTESWVPSDGISSHPKLDERSGELLFFNYSMKAPYMQYGVVGADNQLKHLVPIELPGPRLPHDMAFTDNYSILNDLPLFWDPEKLARGIFSTQLFPELPSRFAIIPRFGQPGDIKWFEAETTYVLHWLNAFEEGDEVVLDGYFQDQPDPGYNADAPAGYGRMMAFLNKDNYKPRLHRWRFNLKTGETREQRLDDQTLEFGMMNQRFAGLPYRYGYSTVPTPGWLLFDGLAKHDLQTGGKELTAFGEQRFGGEAVFAPRTNATLEDDGYLVTFVTDMIEDQSECVLYDASDLSVGPICRIILPHRICSGTHGTWAHGSDIRAAGRNLL